MSNEYRFAPQREVFYPITLERLREDGGGTYEVTFKIRYRLLTRGEMRRLLRETLQPPGQDDAPAEGAMRASLAAALDDEGIARHDAEVLDRVTGWEGIAGEAGAPLEFSRATLVAMMEADAQFARAVERGLWDASRGAPRGN